jgi:hypothetical protein
MEVVTAKMQKLEHLQQAPEKKLCMRKMTFLGAGGGNQRSSGRAKHFQRTDKTALCALYLAFSL